jgi:hypothetical protein
MVATWKDVGVNYGGQHIGKGITRLLKEVDKYAGKAAAPIGERPSTWMTVIGTFAFPVAAVLGKLKDPWDKLAILIGGFLSTGLWDIIEEAMVSAGGAAGAAYVPAYVPPPTVSASAPAQTAVSASAPAQTTASEKVY